MESYVNGALENCMLAVQICEMIIGFFGNVIAIIVILCSRSMHTLTDFYLLSLSTSDLLFLILSLTPEIIALADYSIRQNANRYLDYLWVHCFHQWILQASIHASILTIVAFTGERYLAICHPFLVQSMRKKSRAKKIIAVIWIIAAILALLPAIELYFVFEKFYKGHLKPLPEAFITVWPYLVYIRVVVYFIVPMFLITVMYIMIGIKLNQITFDRQSTSQVERTNTKALKMFAIIILLFFISWAPSYTLELMTYYMFSRQHYYEIASYIMIVRSFTNALSSAFNPIIYVIMSGKFRKAVKGLLSKSQMKLRDWTSSNNNTNTTDISMEIVG